MLKALTHVDPAAISFLHRNTQQKMATIFCGPRYGFSFLLYPVPGRLFIVSFYTPWNGGNSYLIISLIQY